MLDVAKYKGFYPNLLTESRLLPYLIKASQISSYSYSAAIWRGVSFLSPPFKFNLNGFISITDITFTFLLYSVIHNITSWLHFLIAMCIGDQFKLFFNF